MTERPHDEAICDEDVVASVLSSMVAHVESMSSVERKAPPTIDRSDEREIVVDGGVSSRASKLRPAAAAANQPIELTRRWRDTHEIDAVLVSPCNQQASSSSSSSPDECAAYYVLDGGEASCATCPAQTSLFWRRIGRQKTLCNNCFFSRTYSIYFEELLLRTRKSTTNNNNNNSNGKKRPLAQLSVTNSSSSSTSSVNGDDATAAAARSKRAKKDVSAGTDALTTTTLRMEPKTKTCDSVFHRGIRMQIGDIVALYARDDVGGGGGGAYYAQIRAFAVDQWGQKSAYVVWLIPINPKYKSITFSYEFDPNYFILGPPDETARPLDTMVFVCRLKAAHDRLQSLSLSSSSSPSVPSYFDQANQYENELFLQSFAIKDLADSTPKASVVHSYDKLKE